ncbi:MAG: hypothetical protein GY898_04235 [Proteobacteria bacterium]|nr:hypothetical protein [Pseudomonadota bacterium]
MPPESRPAGFYDRWPTFARVYFAEKLARANGGDEIGVVMAAGASSLGTKSLVGLVTKNTALLAVMAPLLGVAAAPLLAAGGAVLVRALSRGANAAEVARIRNQLAAAQTEYEALLRERKAGRLPAPRHEAAVNQLLARLVG